MQDRPISLLPKNSEPLSTLCQGFGREYYRDSELKEVDVGEFERD